MGIPRLARPSIAVARPPARLHRDAEQIQRTPVWRRFRREGHLCGNEASGKKHSLLVREEILVHDVLALMSWAPWFGAVGEGNLQARRGGVGAPRHRLRLRVRRATIVPSGELHGSVLHISPLRDIRLDIDGLTKAEDAIRGCFAGPIAERKFQPTSLRRWHAQADYDQISELAMRVTGAGEIATAIARCWSRKPKRRSRSTGRQSVASLQPSSNTEP
jgi:hypothetical protein